MALAANLVGLLGAELGRVDDLALGTAGQNVLQARAMAGFTADVHKVSVAIAVVIKHARIRGVVNGRNPTAVKPLTGSGLPQLADAGGVAADALLGVGPTMGGQLRRGHPCSPFRLVGGGVIPVLVVVEHVATRGLVVLNGRHVDFRRKPRGQIRHRNPHAKPLLPAPRAPLRKHHRHLQGANGDVVLPRLEAELRGVGLVLVKNRADGVEVQALLEVVNAVLIVIRHHTLAGNQRVLGARLAQGLVVLGFPPTRVLLMAGQAHVGTYVPVGIAGERTVHRGELGNHSCGGHTPLSWLQPLAGVRAGQLRGGGGPQRQGGDHHHKL
ncbi:hypothetical protein HRbin09_01017 [bacterium HR09]|nr:hypothetical protein HRbin09_01017 [bacterium HR09]